MNVDQLRMFINDKNMIRSIPQIRDIKYQFDDKETLRLMFFLTGLEKTARISSVPPISRYSERLGVRFYLVWK